MEIETATNFTLSALTLREKSLAHDLLYSEQYHKVSGAVSKMSLRVGASLLIL